jgi:hypothetical protein
MARGGTGQTIDFRCIDRFSGRAACIKAGQVARPRQASGVGGENAVLAGEHDGPLAHWRLPRWVAAARLIAMPGL